MNLLQRCIDLCDIIVINAISMGSETDARQLQSILMLFLLVVHHCSANSDCVPEAMERCTDPLKMVTESNDLGFATSIEELKQICPKLMDGLRCINEFTFRCLDVDHRNYFNTLYKGTTQVIVDLCHVGEYQSDYLRHAPCMRRVQTGYEQCAQDYQTSIKDLNDQSGDQPTEASAAQSSSSAVAVSSETSEDNVQLLCCSFQRYLRCSEAVVNRTCGHETAKFTKTFLDRMSGPLIHGHCQAYDTSSVGSCVHFGNSGPSGNSVYRGGSEEGGRPQPWEDPYRSHTDPVASATTKLNNNWWSLLALVVLLSLRTP